MTQDERLSLLRLDLQLSNREFDSLLIQKLAAAEQMIAEEGIRLTDSAKDEELRIMYAAFLYRKRAEDNPVMPRMLRWALNNRLFSQKAADNAT